MGALFSCLVIYWQCTWRTTEFAHLGYLLFLNFLSRWICHMQWLQESRYYPFKGEPSLLSQMWKGTCRLSFPLVWFMRWWKTCGKFNNLKAFDLVKCCNFENNFSYDFMKQLLDHSITWSILKSKVVPCKI